MSDRLNDEKFSYWVKTTVALQIAKEGSFGYIQNVMTGFVRILESATDSEHVSRFLKKVTMDNRVKKEHLGKRVGEFKWKIDTNCAKCKSMFDLILEKLDKNYKHVNWKCHASSSTISPPIYWWIICKIYISYNIEASLGPQEVDPLAVFSLLSLCRLFESVKFRVIALIDLRNKLMHSNDNTFSKQEMDDAFKCIKAFLQEDTMNMTSKVAMTELVKLENKQLLIVGMNGESHELISRALLLKKQCLENDLEMERPLGNQRYNELMLKYTAVTAEIDKETKRVNEEERRQTEEIHELIAENSRLKTNLAFEQEEKHKYKEKLETSESEAELTKIIHQGQINLLKRYILILETQRQQYMEQTER